MCAGGDFMPGQPGRRPPLTHLKEAEVSSIDDLAAMWRTLQAEAVAFPSHETKQAAEKARQSLARAAKGARR